jgi:hypothetical protein
MAAKRETRTDRRHEEIYLEYLSELEKEPDPIKRSRLGPTYFCEIVAEKLGWSTRHVRQVINKMIKCPQA